MGLGSLRCHWCIPEEIWRTADAFPYATRTRFKAEQQRKAGLPCCVLDTQKHTMFGPYFPKLRFACSSYLTANHSRKISDHGYIAGDDSAAFVHQGNRRRSHGTTMDLAFPDVGPVKVW